GGPGRAVTDQVPGRTQRHRELEPFPGGVGMLPDNLPDEALALFPRIRRVPALEPGHLSTGAVRHELRYIARLEPAQHHPVPGEFGEVLVRHDHFLPQAARPGHPASLRRKPGTCAGCRPRRSDEEPASDPWGPTAGPWLAVSPVASLFNLTPTTLRPMLRPASACAPSCAITLMCLASRQIPSDTNARSTSSPMVLPTDAGNSAGASPNWCSLNSSDNACIPPPRLWPHEGLTTGMLLGPAPPIEPPPRSPLISETPARHLDKGVGAARTGPWGRRDGRAVLPGRRRSRRAGARARERCRGRRSGHRLDSRRRDPARRQAACRRSRDGAALR